MNNFCLGKNGRRAMRFFAFLLCFSLLFSNLAFGAYAAETEISAEAAGLAADGEANQSSLFEPLAENLLTPAQEDKGEKVKIIIELTDKPLLEYQSKMQSYATVSDFLESDEAQSIETKLQAARTKVEKALLRSDMDITVDREYSTVFNGISVDAYEGDLAAIQKIPGVKNAFVAEQRQLIKPVDYTPSLTESVPAIGGDIVGEDLGYTGKNTVVAILDTGLDTDHEAFGTVNSAKYTQEDIAAAIKNNKLTIGKLNAASVYKSDKVPFAFDYADNDTNVVGGQSHGTHVAGIVGANNGGVVQGVAPDTQFLIMKVFGDNSSGAYDDDILAALDDAVKIGVDAINMSLGSTGGFSTASKTVQAVYDRVKNAGINLLCAAGNDYSSTRNNAAGNDLPLAANPDNGVVGSPSTYSAALSVASMNNTQTTSVYMLVGSEKIRYSDSAENYEQQMVSLEGEYEYVDCGYGSAADFAKVSVMGKIALIQRAGEENGEILTFAQKETNARKAGAVAAIVYDNVEGDLISMATNNSIPMAFISKANGEIMLAAQNKTVSVGSEYVDTFKDAYCGQMSDFSSWGVTPDLKLKPEITAPGGNIYSTLPNDLYGSMSGTSMASPHMAGAAVIMDQYIREQQDGLNMSQNERTALANALMMSTATPIRNGNDLPYSPRQQGAGLVQLQRAVKAKAYLTDADGNLPKAETGSHADGKFSFSLTANSLAGQNGQNIQYQAEITVLTESTVSENGQTFIAQTPKQLTAQQVTVEIPETVSLKAGGKEKINVGVELTEAGKAELDKLFPNGIFIEGFVTLTPVSGDEVSLSYPFMGFYGEWNDVPVFDSDIYDGETAAVCEMQLGQFDVTTGGGYILGHNLYVKGAANYEADKIAIKGGDKTQSVTAVTSLLRSVDSLEFSAADSEDNVVYSETDLNVCKTYHMGEAFHTPMAAKGWVPIDTWNDPLEDGDYTYTVTGTLGGKAQSVHFPVVIDSQKPEVVSSEISGSLWKVKVKDNHYVQAVCVTENGNSALTEWQEPDAKAAGETTELVFDLSQPEFKGLSQAKIAMVDYAGNQFVSEYYSLAGSAVVYPESVSLSKNEVIMTEGDTTQITANVLPANASNRTVSWSSSEPTVAEVDANGNVTAIKEGTAIITAKTVNNLTASCVITVQAAENPEPQVKPVLASLAVPAVVTDNTAIPFTFSLEQMSKVATVSFSFEKTSALNCTNLIGLNGFTSLGIKWTDSDHGVMALSYLQGGAGGSLTKADLTDVARLIMATEMTSGSCGVKLTGVTVTGYDNNGEPIYLTSEIKKADAETNITDRNRYDLNKDGVVDLLDITFAQKYYRYTPDSQGWSSVSHCDLDGNNIIDIEDMILVLLAF